MPSNKYIQLNSIDSKYTFKSWLKFFKPLKNIVHKYQLWGNTHSLQSVELNQCLSVLRYRIWYIQHQWNHKLYFSYFCDRISAISIVFHNIQQGWIEIKEKIKSFLMFSKKPVTVNILRYCDSWKLICDCSLDVYVVFLIKTNCFLTLILNGSFQQHVSWINLFLPWINMLAKLSGKWVKSQ